MLHIYSLSADGELMPLFSPNSDVVFALGSLCMWLYGLHTASAVAEVEAG